MADAEVGESQKDNRDEQEFHLLCSSDQGENFLGCIVATFLGQLNGKGLKVSDLLSSHGW